MHKSELTPVEIGRVVKEVKNFSALLETSLENLEKIIKNDNKAAKLQKDLIDMNEQVMLGKKI